MPEPSQGIEIHDDLTLPDAEVTFETSRSSGPGGQNVNKVESKVSLVFDLDASTALSDEQKERLRDRLGNRISKVGKLRVTAQSERTQAANRRLATERFVALVREALTEQTPRRPTRKPRRIEERRLEEKRRRSETKRLRSQPPE